MGRLAPRGFFFLSYTCITSTRCYLDPTLVREWLGKANDDYGGAKDHELPFGSATLVHIFELAVANC